MAGPGAPKTGGRQRGTPNRRTLGLRMGLVAAGAAPDLAKTPLRQLPLDFLLQVMSDESQPMTTRVDAARAAAPYVHFRKGLVDTSGHDVPITVNIIRFSDVASEYGTQDQLAKPKQMTIEHDALPSSR